MSSTRQVMKERATADNKAYLPSALRSNPASQDFRYTRAAI